MSDEKKSKGKAADKSKADKGKKGRKVASEGGVSIASIHARAPRSAERRAGAAWRGS